jgi:divalent metal cation (Fe/Co/Zn/Cd) transporter
MKRKTKTNELNLEDVLFIKYSYQILLDTLQTIMDRKLTKKELEETRKEFINKIATDKK